MISKSAVRDFLDRELDEWDWLKKLDKNVVAEKIKDFWPDVQYKTYQPMEHQVVSILLGLLNPGFCFFLDMGTGKTLIALNVLRFLKEQEGLGKILVVVPNEVAVESWVKEIELFTEFKAIGLIGSKEDRDLSIAKKADIYLINYGGLQVMMTDFVVNKSKKKNASTRKRKVNIRKATQFAHNFDAVVYDEIHHCKNSKSLQFELCDVLSENTAYRYGLTGTPFGRDPSDLWAEFYLCDRGETLGTSLEMFQQAFFTKRTNYMGYPEWVFDNRKKFKLNKVIKHRSIRYEDKECNDLPGSTKIPVPLKMPPETKAYYIKLITEARESAKADPLARENTYIKMRQLASGFLYLKNEETGEKVDVIFPANPKLEMLEELLEDIPQDKKIVIFHEFNKSCDLIEGLLKKKKIDYVALNGRTKDPAACLRKFQDPKNKCRVFVVNSKSGSSSLNLQIAKFMIFFETPVSPIVRKQAEKRSDRTGQTEKVFIYDLYIENSVEERIYEFLKEGKDLFDSLMKGEYALF